MEDEWELFDTSNDYSLMNDLADEHPEKLEELKALFLRWPRTTRCCPSAARSTPGSTPRR
jgi:arylsulfatase A-like enzyme